MKEGDLEFSVLFADNDKIGGVYEVRDGLKSSRRKFVQCFPVCCQEHSCDKFCGTPVSVVLTANLKDKMAASCFQFDDMAFVAELKPIDANYTLQTPLSRAQLSKQMKQSGFLYSGNLVASTRGRQHNGDNTVQNGYYEFALNAQNLPEPRRKEALLLDTLYTFSVTVLIPLDNKDETVSKGKAEKDKDNLLHPVAYFDSAPFFLKASSGDKDSQSIHQSSASQLPTPSDLQEAQSLISLFHTMQTERMALERRDLHVRLTSYANNKKNPPKTTSTSAATTTSAGPTSQQPIHHHQHQHLPFHLQHHQQHQQRREKRPLDASMLMPPSKQTKGCVPLDLVTEDIFEILQESTALAQRPYHWQSHKGRNIRDPTVGMMRGLVQQSALEKALYCITKHNSILHGDIALEDETDGMVVDDSVAPVDTITAAAAEGQEKAKEDSEQSREKEREKEKARLIANVQANSKTYLAKTFSTTSATQPVASAAAAPVPVSSVIREHGLSNNGQEKSTGTVTAQELPEGDLNESDVLSLEHLKKQLMSKYRNPHESLLQRQCFSDMLQSITKSTWQVALRVRRAAERTAPPLPAIPSTAFSLYLSVMQDSKVEHHNLTKAFLASDPPPLKALSWAMRYLRGHNELNFRTSRISAQTVAATAAANAASAAASAAAAAAASASASAPVASSVDATVQQQQQQPLVPLVQNDSTSQLLLPDKSALETAFAQSMQAEDDKETEKELRGKEKGNAEEGSAFKDALEGETNKDGPLPLPLPGTESSAASLVSASAVLGEKEAPESTHTTYIKQEKVSDNGDSFSSELDTAAPCLTLSTSVPAPTSAPVAAPCSNNVSVLPSTSSSAPVSRSPQAPLRDPAEILAQFKALLAADSTDENSDQGSVSEAAPALALVALVSDYVCSGACDQLAQKEQRAAEVRRQLHAQVATTHANQCALLQEAFLWESSQVSLEYAGRTADYFPTYRATPLGPLIVNNFPNEETKRVKSTKPQLSAEAAAAALAFHESLKRGVDPRLPPKENTLQLKDPDGPPQKIARGLGMTSEPEPEAPAPVPRVKRNANNNNNNNGQKDSPARPKRAATKEPKSSRRTATSSPKPKGSNTKKKGKGKGKGKVVKTVLAETRPVHRLTSMLNIPVGGTSRQDHYHNREEGENDEGEGEGEGGSLGEGVDDAGEESDGNSLK
eukprot:gene18608-21177_t